MSIPVWFLPIFASAIALGFYDICKKHAVRENSVMPVLFYATLTGSTAFVLITLLRGEFRTFAVCPPHVFLLLFLKSMLVATSWTCVYYAMRELPISIASPIRASSPLWTFLGSLLLYQEFPSLWQAVGMALIFCGYYAFSLLGKMEGISFRRHRGIHLILLGTLLGAGSALYDKYLLSLLHLPAGTVQFWFSIDLVLILGTAYLVRTFCFGQKHEFHWRWTIPATGLLLILADFLYFYALSLPEIRISILSLIRRCNCIVTFAFGVYLFKDTNVKWKAAALGVILAGVVILALTK